MMPVILIIDDHPFSRMDALEALKNSGYKVRTLTNAELTEQMIEAVKPDLVLINRQPDSFDSVQIFMAIKEKYPFLPVMQYALKSDTAIRSLQQSIRMAMNEARTAARRQNLPELRLPGAIRIFNKAGRNLMKPDRSPADTIKR